MVAPITRALVTGASAGIGARFAHHLADRGAELVLVARRGERLTQLAAQLPTRAEVLPADLADPEALMRVEARLADTDAPVDLLVNNAGFGVYGAAVDMDLRRQIELVDVNVTALLRLTQAALPGLIARGSGGLINVGSLAGDVPTPLAAAYGASKAFVHSYTHAIHEELRGTGVHAMLLAPGVTSTEFGAVAGVNGSGTLPPRLRSEADAVVRRAIDDFTRRRAVSMPGAHNRIASRLAGFAPAAVVRRVSGAAHRRAVEA